MWEKGVYGRVGYNAIGLVVVGVALIVATAVTTGEWRSIARTVRADAPLVAAAPQESDAGPTACRNGCEVRECVGWCSICCPLDMTPQCTCDRHKRPCRPDEVPPCMEAMPHCSCLSTDDGRR